jgi:hypothetical protein
LYGNNFYVLWNINKIDKEKLVSAWIILHKDELLADWTLAQNGELPYNIEPLK